MARFHELVADLVDDPTDVVVATETDRSLFVAALVAAGYTVLAVNPMSTSRYRERHSTSGAKSDPGDARVLAELARTDAHNHRPIAGDSEAAEAIKVLAWAHQSLVWTRQRQINQLRSTLREYYPAALEAFPELGSGDARAVLAVAPTPTLGRRLSQSKIAAALRRGGRQRRIEERAAEIQRRFATISSRRLLPSPRPWARRCGPWSPSSTRSPPRSPASRPSWPTVLISRVRGRPRALRRRQVSQELRRDLTHHPRQRQEPNRARPLRPQPPPNRRLADACYLWAFASLTASPGCRAFYDARRTAGDTHNRALRALANRLVGLLHGCLHHGALYDEHTAWGHRTALAA